jgi:hypothetical protein
MADELDPTAPAGEDLTGLDPLATDSGIENPGIENPGQDTGD